MPVINHKVLEQFDAMKKKHPDALLLFREGDFYSTYKQDAVKASEILNITLTRMKPSRGDVIEKASFPHFALDNYLPKLVRSGARVAICEQLEPPKKKVEKDKSQTIIENDMPKKKKEQSTGEPAATKSPVEETAKEKKSESAIKEVDVNGLFNELKTKGKAKLSDHVINEQKPEVKAESKESRAGSKTEAKAQEKGDKYSVVEMVTPAKKEEQTEKKHREPQMVTVNGEKVTHGHAFQSTQNKEDWYFTAKIDGQQLKPQKMDAADVAAYSKKEITVPQLMEKYYPTKLMKKVPEEAFKYPNGLAGPDGAMTVEKFNVYKEKDEQRPDFGKYKFFARVDGQNMSTVASRQDLNAYFDRVKTPGELVEQNFGAKLHLPTYYKQFKLPEGVDPSGVHVAKDRSDGKWKVSVDLGDRGRTEKKEISFDDGYSLFKSKTANREQIAAKYLGSEISEKMKEPVKMEAGKTYKMV